MKKFIVKIFIFFIIMLALNLLYLYIIQETDWDFKKRIESLNLNSPKYDILILGNSLAMDGIDTRYMNEHALKAYNLAFAGASLKTNYIQLQEYINTYKYKPKYVILGLGSYLNDFKSNTIHPIVDFTRINNSYHISDIPMLKFKWKFKEILKKLVSKPHREAYLDYGQLKFKKKITDKTTVDFNNKFLLEKYMDSIILKDIIKLSSANNIKLFIIEMPGFKKERHVKIFDYKIIDEAKVNGFLLDFNTIEFCKIFKDDEDWIGRSHLNVFGAKKFTKELLKRINLKL